MYSKWINSSTSLGDLHEVMHEIEIIFEGMSMDLRRLEQEAVDSIPEKVLEFYATIRAYDGLPELVQDIAMSATETGRAISSVAQYRNQAISDHGEEARCKATIALRTIWSQRFDEPQSPTLGNETKMIAHALAAATEVSVALSHPRFNHGDATDYALTKARTLAIETTTLVAELSDPEIQPGFGVIDYNAITLAHTDAARMSLD